MSRQINIADEVYNYLKEHKNKLSFSNFIKGLYAGNSKPELELINEQVKKLGNRMDRIEDFVRQKSGGQYE